MFEKFLTNSDSWLNGKGPSSGIVFSSRIRLARNLSGFPFPHRASDIQKIAVLRKMEEAQKTLKTIRETLFIEMSKLNDLDRLILLERHLVSKQHLDSLVGKGLIVSNDERIAIMVNEEDHLRLQVINSGLDLRGCWNLISEIDDEISKQVEISYQSDLGYLTTCPTNVGTALRVSCMLHLPALILTKKINKILELLAKISITTRGLFGEGTQALGDFFQISNQVSLGLSEGELIDNLLGVVNQVKEQEIDARESLLKKHKFNLEDNIWRALGILQTARLISSKEALSHLSMLSLGLDLGIIKGVKSLSGTGARELINSLFIIIQPAHLQKIEDKILKENERDSIRAAILRERLK